MWNRKELKTRAKAILKSSYWKAFLVSLIIAIVGGGTQGCSFKPPSDWLNQSQRSVPSPFQSGPSLLQDIPSQLQEPRMETVVFIFVFIAIFMIVMALVIAFRVFLGYPLEVGARRYFNYASHNDVNLNSLGYVFEKGRYMDVIKGMLWRALFTFLWTLLFVIPGIVKSYAYSMVPYILAENPNIGYRRALELSMRMTAGQKFKIWVLDLSFLGWYLLGMLAFFVGTLFVLPYVNTTKAELYLVLRNNAIANGWCRYDELLLTHSQGAPNQVNLEKSNGHTTDINT